jgi:hypothetical protein
MTTHEMPRHRAPSTCPVCAHRLITTALGCPDCGTSVSGAFRPCAYCTLDDDDLEALSVFLVSRGNLREFATHLGVSYPTARLRYAELLERLGLAPAAPVVDRDQVLEDLASGRLSIDEAEALLRR